MKMADPKADVVSNWICEEGSNLEYRPIRSLILDAISARVATKSQEERAELAENLENEVLNELSITFEQNLADGVTPRFLLSSEQGTHYIKFLSQPELALLDELRAGTPTEFEHFCKLILEKIGAVAMVEGGPADGGVDFVAYDIRLGNFEGPSPKGARAGLIGQAKKYRADHPVSEHELRAFVGSATRRSFLLRRDYPSNIGITQPMVYAFWTTSDFNRSAKDFAREMGLWYLNGVALCQLARRLGIEHKI